MSKKTHQKELARARAKRDAERKVEQTGRNRMFGAIGIVVLALVVVGVAVASRGGDDGPSVDDFAFQSDGATATDLPSEPATGSEPASAVVSEPASDPANDPGVAGTSAESCENPGEGAPEPNTEMAFDAPPPDDYAAGMVTATVETTCGRIVFALDADAAPQTVSSFAFLADEGFYAGVPFHRVQDQFVIQGGDPTGTGSGGPGYTFDDELTLAQETVDANGNYPRGTVAMANSGANTNGSQFFVVQAAEGYAFPPNYAVFGTVVEGMDIVDRIAQGPVGGPNGDLAVDPVRMISVTIS